MHICYSVDLGGDRLHSKTSIKISAYPHVPGIPCQLALEAPMACGMGTCKGCAVMGTDGVYRYVCYDGPVFDAADIFEAAS